MNLVRKQVWLLLNRARKHRFLQYSYILPQSSFLISNHRHTHATGRCSKSTCDGRISPFPLEDTHFLKKIRANEVLSIASLFCSLSRNATTTPRTRHAQLLLPFPWRSGSDHAAARMVSRKKRCRVDFHPQRAGSSNHDNYNY